MIPVHGHYDHAMDAPMVARKTGALIHASVMMAAACGERSDKPAKGPYMGVGAGVSVPS